MLHNFTACQWLWLNERQRACTCRGIVTTSPSFTFLVLTNNTKTRRAREQNKTAPAYLDWMTYHEFTARCHHKAPLLYYKQEYHYFQGIPYQELSLDEALDTLPAQCWNSRHRHAYDENGESHDFAFGCLPYCTWNIQDTHHVAFAGRHLPTL